ncbi:hypothetical protein NUU61_006182 [Penicillium alfredii]|uniref:DUF4045 domain-containing protein n=1 Tax=Penicillium alfredii TaxID=1506179 RepID=A0A9W9F0E9_9EURO|nr:uncharacterized protein NUU61_006182 [Penicillium alfredii]KAJ5091312.1 hypothetical protein NUU61_006182 [Penicillium alfredii]
MTTPTNPDGSEDVNDFLSRIRELGERRDKEDEERTKKLEEEILQGRKERQARRAERARSIAPTNDSPTLSASLGHRSIDPPEQLEPTLQTLDPETPGRADRTPDTAAQEDHSRRGSVQDAEMDSPSRALPPLSRSRTGTLSWQQRPSSRDFGSKSPGSASPTRSSHLRNASTASDENQLSRAQIAQSLSSKDPSWFRQTPDRGLGSPAYRKSEEPPDHRTDLGMGRRLPGMSRESTAEPEKTDGAEEISPPRTASTAGDSSLDHRYSSVSSVSQATRLGSPRRMSPERTRSTSPTKGLGGFVQSAMMKRSDSVSKRWSAQIPQGLSRGNSVIKNRNSFVGPSLSDMAPATTGLRDSREVSSFPSERPFSSHSEATVARPTSSTERPTTPSTGNNDIGRAEGSPSRPALYGHARSGSLVNQETQGSDTPSSPSVSRTMDPKRWSPTKASWLESALNRPETSPRHKKQPSQSSWARERQSRGSVDMGRVNNFKEVTPVGLMRTPPLGTHFKKPSITGTPSIYGSSDANKAKEPVPEPPAAAAETEKPPTKVEPEKTRDAPPVLQETEPQKPTAVPEPSPKPEPSLEPELSSKSEQYKTEPSPEPETSRKTSPPVLGAKPNLSISPVSSREPTASKPKPQSPAMDLRANLRKRDTAKDTGPTQEPEFKNVFGKLKKTETRNYVAPDELKSNILRGKAALNVTGGPKKTQRVDEFKDSILKQKEAMKAGGGSVRRNTAGEDDAPPKRTSAVPEAIAKRNTMTRTNSVRQKIPSNESSPRPSADIGTPRTSQDQQPQSPPPRESVNEEPHAITTPIEPEADDLRFQSSLKQEENQQNSVNSIEPSTEAAQKPVTEAINSVRGLPSANVAETAGAASVTPSLAAKGKLAGRINPALAGILSRGPPAAAEHPNKKEPVTPVSGEGGLASSSTSLTHKTKGRARGPKRRLPKGSAAPATSSAQSTQEVGAISSSEVTKPQTAPVFVDSSDNNSERLSQPNSVPDVENTRPESPVTRQVLGVKTSFQDALNSGLQQGLGTPSPKTAGDVNGYVSRNVDHAPRGVETPGAVSPSSRPLVPPKPSSSPSPPPSTSKPQWSQQARYASSSPSPLRTSFKENRMETPSTPSQKSIPGVTVAEVRDPVPRNFSHPSPPVPIKRADISLEKPADPHRLSRKMSAPSLVAQAAEAREVIAGFFKTSPNPRDRMDIDPQLMLNSKADDTKMRTVKRHIWELTGDGKRQELPVNQEYILYEGSMYLCVHLFEAQGGNKTDVYLWCGDDVSEAALEDAQLFARKVARENSCKLAVIRQGKEPRGFIQALGGIMITRRGSSSRSNSSALYMLCGRKHLGQMAFDEVDYSLRNLCSGFPFVISAPFGKLYLWKGKGSGPEETGAARLIGMDLGLTGEFEEVAEDEEPESFYEVFAGSREAAPHLLSEYWKLKPKYDHFRTRLLRVDHERGQPHRFWMRRPGSGSPVVRPNDTVQEVEPFCYKDLTEKDVYVLDTFFEIYVIVGEHASQKSAEFASAVVFAHEYGILATSLQDRPFIPKSLVALGGIPDRCQSAFRKWDQRSLHAPCVFPLDVAIEAIRSQEGRD